MQVVSVNKATLQNELGVGSRQRDWKAFLYFYLPHTVIEITKNIKKVEKRSGEET